MHTTQKNCPACGGSGQDFTQPPLTHGHPICKQCWGTGKVFESVFDVSDWFPANKTIMVPQDDYDALKRERDQLQHDLDDAKAEIKRLRLVLHGIANPGLFTTFSSEEIARKALEYKEEK